MTFLRDQDGTIARLTPLRSCFVVTRLDQNPKPGESLDAHIDEVEQQNPSIMISATASWSP